ncbi:MAG: hypothetical protein ACR2JO_09530 [Mycobacteriales bacterium]
MRSAAATTSARRTGRCNWRRNSWLLFRRPAIIACEYAGLADPPTLTVVVNAVTAYGYR